MTEQKFTDEDLKRLETFIQYDEGVYLRKAVQALVARLEAAEAIVKEVIPPTEVWHPKLVEAWRKVSGK